jgi:integrase
MAAGPRSCCRWTAHPRVAVLGIDHAAAASGRGQGEDELARQVFPAPVAGGKRDPSNTLETVRQALKHAGFDGVTSHYFRKTVATLMDEAGLSARSAADQLGHAKPSLTADIYMGRKKRATGAAEVLEGLFQP